MPTLTLATGLVNMHDRFGFTDKDWNAFLQARILSIQQTEKAVPTTLLFHETMSVDLPKKRRDELHALFQKALEMHQIEDAVVSANMRIVDPATLIPVKGG